jgi:hypothetical protein
MRPLTEMEMIVLLGFAAAIPGAFIYLLPWLVARHRKHRNTLAILLLNLFLGWTLVGWTIALVWAVYREKENYEPLPSQNPFARPPTPHF